MYEGCKRHARSPSPWPRTPRALDVEACGRRAPLAACCPDVLYRSEAGDRASLVVDSHGALSVIDFARAAGGFPVPASVRWLDRP